jgi:hypothetical protein
VQGNSSFRESATVTRLPLSAALGEEFGFGIPRYVQFTSELLFDPPQGGEEFGHPNRAANNHQINVTLRLLLTPRNGAVDGGALDPTAESCEVGLELDAGADWKIEESYGGENPAINAGFRTPEMVKLFLEKGADIDALSIGGHTMLMNAASQMNPLTVKFLIDAGANINIRNTKGETALSIAEQCRKDYWHSSPETSKASQEIIGYLVEHGAVR